MPPPGISPPNTIPDIPVAATLRPERIGGPIEQVTVTAVASPELRKKDQYFDQLYGPMNELARKINVPVELLLGHGVAEGGWGVTAPGSNNSVFGFSQNENAIRFPSPQASIDAFGNGYWGKALAGKQSLDDYLTELHRVPGHDFNSKREDYDPWVRGRVNDVRAALPGWKARRGIE